MVGMVEIVNKVDTVDEVDRVDTVDRVDVVYTVVCLTICPSVSVSLSVCIKREHQRQLLNCYSRRLRSRSVCLSVCPCCTV